MGGIELARAFVNVRADASQVSGDLRNARPGIESSVNELASLFGSIRAQILGIAGMAGAIGAVFSAGKFEQTFIALETMIGSAKETQRTLAALTEFAAKTPFEMPEIEQAARGLIMFGERGDELMETLNMLGNAASGTSTPFGMIALIFNQIRGVGKLLTQDFRQLSTRGVLSLQDIAKHFGVTTQAAQEMLSKGRISFEDVRSIFKELSGEGGRFNNLMEKQSRSFLGLWSTYKDVFNLMARAIGESLLPAAKKLVDMMIWLTDSFREFIINHPILVRVLTSAGAAFVAFNGLLFAYSALMKTATIATIFFKSATGIGLAQVVVGLAVATTTVALMNKAMAGTTEEAQKASQSMKKYADDVKAIGTETATTVGNLGKESVRHSGQVLSELLKKQAELERVNKRLAPFGGTTMESFRAAGMTHEEMTLGTWLVERNRILGDLTSLEEEYTKVTDKEKTTEEERAKEAAKYIDNLQEQANLVGATELEKKLYQLNEKWRLGEIHAVEAQRGKELIKQADAKEKAIEASKKEQEEIRKANDEIRSLSESILTPFEKITQEIQKWRERLGAASPLFKRFLLDRAKQYQPQPEMITGRMGIADFGKRLQDAMLGKKINEEQLAVQKLIQSELVKANVNQKDIANAIRGIPLGLQ